MRATDKVIQKNQNTAKKSKIGYTITKWQPKNQFPSCGITFPTKNGKTTFPKEFFLEITQLKLNLQKVIRLRFYGENKKQQRPQNANLC